MMKINLASRKIWTEILKYSFRSLLILPEEGKSWFSTPRALRDFVTWEINAELITRVDDYKVQISHMVVCKMDRKACTKHTEMSQEGSDSIKAGGQKCASDCENGDVREWMDPKALQERSGQNEGRN